MDAEPSPDEKCAEQVAEPSVSPERQGDINNNEALTDLDKELCDFLLADDDGSEREFYSSGVYIDMSEITSTMHLDMDKKCEAESDRCDKRSTDKTQHGSFHKRKRTRPVYRGRWGKGLGPGRGKVLYERPTAKSSLKKSRQGGIRLRSHKDNPPPDTSGDQQLCATLPNPEPVIVQLKVEGTRAVGEDSSEQPPIEPCFLQSTASSPGQHDQVMTLASESSSGVDMHCAREVHRLQVHSEDHKPTESKISVANKTGGQVSEEMTAMAAVLADSPSKQPGELPVQPAEPLLPPVELAVRPAKSPTQSAKHSPPPSAIPPLATPSVESPRLSAKPSTSSLSPPPGSAKFPTPFARPPTSSAIPSTESPRLSTQEVQLSIPWQNEPFTCHWRPSSASLVHSSAQAMSTFTHTATVSSAQSTTCLSVTTATVPPHSQSPIPAELLILGSPETSKTAARTPSPILKIFSNEGTSVEEGDLPAVFSNHVISESPHTFDLDCEEVEGKCLIPSYRSCMVQTDTSPLISSVSEICKHKGPSAPVAEKKPVSTLALAKMATSVTESTADVVAGDNCRYCDQNRELGSKPDQQDSSMESISERSKLVSRVARKILKVSSSESCRVTETPRYSLLQHPKAQETLHNLAANIDSEASPTDSDIVDISDDPLDSDVTGNVQTKKTTQPSETTESTGTQTDSNTSQEKQSTHVSSQTSQSDVPTNTSASSSRDHCQETPTQNGKWLQCPQPPQIPPVAMQWTSKGQLPWSYPADYRRWSQGFGLQSTPAFSPVDTTIPIERRSQAFVPQSMSTSAPVFSPVDTNIPYVARQSQPFLPQSTMFSPVDLSTSNAYGPVTDHFRPRYSYDTITRPAPQTASSHDQNYPDYLWTSQSASCALPNPVDPVAVIRPHHRTVMELPPFQQDIASTVRHTQRLCEAPSSSQPFMISLADKHHAGSENNSVQGGSKDDDKNSGTEPSCQAASMQVEVLSDSDDDHTAEKPKGTNKKSSKTGHIEVVELSESDIEEGETLTRGEMAKAAPQHIIDKARASSLEDKMSEGKLSLEQAQQIPLLSSINSSSDIECMPVYVGHCDGDSKPKTAQVITKKSKDMWVCQCALCPQQFRNPEKVHSHMEQYHSKYIHLLKALQTDTFFFCRHCNYVTALTEALWYHFVVYHKVEVTQDPHCEPAAPDDIQVLPTIGNLKNANRAYMCVDCRLIMLNRRKLVAHIYSDHPWSPFKKSGYVQMKEVELKKFPVRGDPDAVARGNRRLSKACADICVCCMCLCKHTEESKQLVHQMDYHSNKTLLYVCTHCEMRLQELHEYEAHRRTCGKGRSSATLVEFNDAKQKFEECKDLIKKATEGQGQVEQEPQVIELVDSDQEEGDEVVPSSIQPSPKKGHPRFHKSTSKRKAPRIPPAVTKALMSDFDRPRLRKRSKKLDYKDDDNVADEVSQPDNEPVHYTVRRPLSTPRRAYVRKPNRKKIG